MFHRIQEFFLRLVAPKAEPEPEFTRREIRLAIADALEQDMDHLEELMTKYPVEVTADKYRWVFTDIEQIKDAIIELRTYGVSKGWCRRAVEGEEENPYPGTTP